MYKLLLFDRNTQNLTTVCKFYVLDKNTWYRISVQINDYKQMKKMQFEKKIIMEHWKYNCY